MRFALAILIFASACSPFKRAQKHWDKLQEEIKAHPELADTFKIVKPDTLKVESVKTEVKVKRVVDTVAVDSLARLLLEARSRKPEIIEKIARAVCPEVAKDTVVMIQVSNNSVKLFIPVTLSVWAKGSELRVRFKSDSVRMPDPREVVKVEFKEAPKSHWRNVWFWVSVGLFIVLIGVIFKK